MKKIILFVFIITALMSAQAPPDTPTGLKAEINEWMGIKSITLNWNSVTGRDIYFNVYRKTNDEPGFIKFPVMMHSTMFHDKFVLPDNTYYYFLTAVNKYGESTPSDTISVELSDSTPNAFVYGKVTEDETDNPVHAMVNIVPVLGWSFRHMMTDSSGEYGISVNAGKYFISFAARGYYPEFYDNVTSIFEAETITLNENDSINISAGLKSFNSQQKYQITGRVTNNTGQGVKARVQLVILNRGMFDHHFKGTATDSLGNYTLWTNEGDSLAIFAWPLNRNYLPEFYNNKKDFTEADKFVVTGDMNDIDFVLEERPAYNNSIAGKVTTENSEGLPATVTAFKLRENDSRKFTRTVVTDSLGDYKLENLVPGYYLLLAIPVGGYLPSFYKYDGTQTFKWREADSIVVTDNSELTGFDFNLLPYPDSGFARITGLVKDPSDNAVNGAIVYITNENSSVSAYATSDEKGQFTIDYLAPGTYTLSASKFNYESLQQKNITLDYIDNRQQSVSITMTPLTATKAEEPFENIIHDYNLFQNYPNPFNPVTAIKYQIPAAGMVTLKVYNLIGQEIATLVNSNKPAGEYTVQFNAGDLNSGIYFYKLNAGNKVYTRKMIILK